MKRKRNTEIFMDFKNKISKVEIENMTLSFQELELANKKLKKEKYKINHQKKELQNNELLLHLYKLELVKRENKLKQDIQALESEKLKFNEKINIFNKEKDDLDEQRHQLEWLIEARVKKEIIELENKWFSKRPITTFYS